MSTNPNRARRNAGPSPEIIEYGLTGKVVKWVAERGYGFIKTESQPRDVFVHVRHLSEYPTVQQLPVGDSVTFDLARGDKGPLAVNVASA